MAGILTLAFVCISAVGIAYLVIYYPGTGMYDTLAILKNEGFGLAKQHPWFYLLLVQSLVKIVLSCGGGYEASLVVLSLIQIFLTAGVYSYCLMWLYSRKLNVVVWGMVAIAYTFCPFLSITMVNLFKDVPFSLLLLAWMPVLVEYFESSGENLKKKSVLAEICLCLILSLLRNNGVYVSCFILITMLITCPRKWKFTVVFYLCWD